MNSWIEIRPVAGDLSRTEQTAAWQALVREKLGRELGPAADRIEIGYAENGAPEVCFRPTTTPERDDEGLPKNSRPDSDSVCRRSGADFAPTEGEREGIVQNVQPRPKAEEVRKRHHSDDKPGYISVSHTKGWVAVMYDPRRPCAVDIELRSRPLPESVARRYGLRSMDDWCAREAQYKHSCQRPPATPDVAQGTSAKSRSEIPTVRFLPHPDLIVAVIP